MSDPDEFQEGTADCSPENYTEGGYHENAYDQRKDHRSLGLPDDSRDFSDAASLLRYFVGDKPIRLLTNNPKKINDLKAHGLEGITPVKHVAGVSDNNRRYLEAKQGWGHELTEEDLKDG